MLADDAPRPSPNSRPHDLAQRETTATSDTTATALLSRSAGAPDATLPIRARRNSTTGEEDEEEDGEEEEVQLLEDAYNAVIIAVLGQLRTSLFAFSKGRTAWAPNSASAHQLLPTSDPSVRPQDGSGGNSTTTRQPPAPEQHGSSGPAAVTPPSPWAGGQANLKFSRRVTGIVAFFAVLPLFALQTGLLILLMVDLDYELPVVSNKTMANPTLVMVMKVACVGLVNVTVFGDIHDGLQVISLTHLSKGFFLACCVPAFFKLIICQWVIMVSTTIIFGSTSVAEALFNSLVVAFIADLDETWWKLMQSAFATHACRHREGVHGNHPLAQTSPPKNPNAKKIPTRDFESEFVLSQRCATARGGGVLSHVDQAVALLGHLRLDLRRAVRQRARGGGGKSGRAVRQFVNRN